MRAARTAAPIAAIVALVLVGCGADDEQGPGGDGSVPPTSVAPEPPASDPEPEPSEPSDEPTRIGVGELVGVPEPGVEAGCWLLDGYLLLGGDEELLSSGQRLRVTGEVQRDVMTTCQQGIAFRVETVEPLD